MTGLQVTVFGGSVPKAGDPAYAEAFLLGTLLGKGGYTVLTGGYMGTMEAVSRGANEAGTHVVGITCEEIEAWRDAQANAWVVEEIKLKTLNERLYALIERCDAAIALPGGVGTLAEIATMWNQMQTHAIAMRPLVLIEHGWHAVFAQMFSQFDDYVPAAHRSLLHFAANSEQAYRVLPQLLEQRSPPS